MVVPLPAMGTTNREWEEEALEKLSRLGGGATGEEEEGPEDEEEDEERPEVLLAMVWGGEKTTRGTGGLLKLGRRGIWPSGKGW